MGQAIAVVSNLRESPWTDAASAALHELGEVSVLSEAEMSGQIETSCYDLVIVDASAINNPIAEYVAHFHQRRPDIPVLVVTTSPTWRRAREVFLAGAADYIHRSYDLEKLLGICRELLRHINAVILI